MFRKPSKKRKPSKIRNRQEKQDDDDDDDQEDVSLQDKIRSTQKRQKILSSLPLVTVDPSRRNGKKTSSKVTNSLENATGEMSVLAKKHYMAMQMYIEEELNKNNKNNNPKGTADSNPNDGNRATTNAAAGADDEETLYQELAKEVYSQRQLENQQAREERGAVLVGGTGMAEVVLPPSQNNDNNSRGQQFKHRVYRRDVSSSSALPASSNKTKTTLKSSAVSQFRSFRPDKRDGNGGRGAAQMPQEENKGAESTSNAESSTIDGDRAGFNAYRGRPTKKKPIVKKQRDDSAFSDFVKYQRTKMTNGR